MRFISVVVPVYNAQETISLCLDSLVNQAYDREAFEVIVVDNGSTDSTAGLIKSYPVRYVYFDDIKTSYAARNKGIEVSRGELIAFTDVDCRADSKWLYEISQSFEDKQIGGVAGNIVPDGFPRSTHQFCTDGKQKILLEASGRQVLPWINTANAIYRKDVLYEAGLFNDYFISSGDVDLSWRVCLAGYRLHYEPNAVVYHKLREEWLNYYRQHFRVGYGKAQLYKRYNNIFNDIPASSVQKLWQIWNDFCEEMFCKLIKSIYPSSIFIHLPWDFIQVLAEYTGRIYGWFVMRSKAEKLLEPIAKDDIIQNRRLCFTCPLDDEKMIVQDDGAVWWRTGENISFFNISDGHRFTLEGPGAELWQYLINGKDFSESVKLIHRDYDIEFERLTKDLFNIIEELEKHGLIRIQFSNSINRQEAKSKGALI